MHGAIRDRPIAQHDFLMGIGVVLISGLIENLDVQEKKAKAIGLVNIHANSETLS